MLLLTLLFCCLANPGLWDSPRERLAPPNHNPANLELSIVCRHRCKLYQGPHALQHPPVALAPQPPPADSPAPSGRCQALLEQRGAGSKTGGGAGTPAQGAAPSITSLNKALWYSNSSLSLKRLSAHPPIVGSAQPGG